MALLQLAKSSPRGDDEIMADLKRVGELMIPMEKYPHIPFWFTLRQAMAEMEHSELEINGRKSLPRYILVFDEKYRLMGLVRRRDILRGLEPEFLLDKTVEERRGMFNLQTDPHLWEISLDKIMDGTKSRAERQVSEIMRPIEQTVDYNDHVFRVIYEMNVNRISLLPVLKDGRVIGVIRTVDVFHEVARFVL
jgi:CBS domain-containing protein